MIVHEAVHYWNNDFYEPSRLGFCKPESLNVFMEYIVAKLGTIIDGSINISITDKGNICIEFRERDKFSTKTNDPDDIVDSTIIIRAVEVFEGIS